MNKRKKITHFVPLVEWKENNCFIKEYCARCHHTFHAGLPLYELIGVGYLCDSCAESMIEEGSAFKPTKKPFKGLIGVEKKAYLFAERKHRGQRDDLGRDYFQSHILNVVSILKQCREVSKAMIVAAYLHDTLEDTKTTHDELQKTFGKTVADLVLELTHEGKPDTKGYFFPRLKSKEAIIIKFADRLSNLSRMGCWNEKKQEHYLGKSRFWKKGDEL